MADFFNDLTQIVASTDLRKQDMPFMFEFVGQDGTVEEYLLPINPETYRISYPTRATVTQTLAGAFEDNIGMGLPKIAIQGTFGFLGTLPGGHGKHIANDDKSGWHLYKELEDTFFRFYERFGTYTMGGEKNGSAYDPSQDAIAPVCRFYNYTDKAYYEVQINKFDLLRSTQRQFLQQYDIQMTCLRRLDEPTWQEDFLLALLEPEKITTTDLLQTLFNGYKTIYGAMSDAQTYLTDLKNKIDIINSAIVGFSNGVSNTIKTGFSVVLSAIETVDSLFSAVENLANLPHEIIDQCRTIKRDLYRLSFSMDKFEDVPSTTTSQTVKAAGVVEVLTAPIPAGAYGLHLMDVPEVTLFDTSTESVTTMTARQETILEADSLESIAKRTLGDAAAWSRIAAANDLEYPYIVATPKDSLSDSLGSGSLVARCQAGSRQLWVVGVTCQAGQWISLGNYVDIRQVESVNGNAVILTEGVATAHDPGTQLTIHSRRLSVAIPGTQLKVPASGQARRATFDAWSKDFATRLYGTDEYLNEDGEHAADPSGDTATISGYDNLAMQLRHRLMTARGELASLGHPEYGSIIPTIIGRAGEEMWFERIKLETETTILQDPRVARVENMQFRVEGAGVYVEADIVPINQTNAQRVALFLA